jgi:curved DNA-binding protein CbpA
MTHDRGARATDFYRLLQVDPEADVEIIGAAYRKLAQRYHPDLTDDPVAASRMAAINAAWEVLRDPAKRAAYDRERRFGAPPPTARHGGAGSDASTPRAATPTEPGGWTPGGRSSWSGAAASTASGEKWRAGSAAGTGGTQDPWVGPPPGREDGTVLTFGRYRGWSLGEIGRRDAGYLEWLERAPIGRQYQGEIADILRRMGRRR